LTAKGHEAQSLTRAVLLLLGKTPARSYIGTGKGYAARRMSMSMACAPFRRLAAATP